MSDGLPQPLRGLALLTIAFSVAMSVIDSAIVNVALPSISTDLAVTPARAIWVVNAYQLAITVSLLPLASLGDILSYRTVYRAGIVLFTLASLACGLSDSLVTLTLARIVQGLGAAGVMSVNLALIRAVYPKALLGAAVGNVALIVAVCSAIGPSLGAAILSIAPWRWLFFVNGPIGLFAGVLAFRVLPATPRLDQRLDLLSVALNALTFGLLITGVDALGARDLRPAALELAGAAIAAGLLTWRQFGLPLPVLPIDLLRRPVFALSMVSSVSAFGSVTLLQVGMPFFLVSRLHMPITQVGALMTAFPVAITLIATLSGRLADKYPPGILGAAGLIVLSLGLASAALTPDSPSWFDIVWRLALAGLGFGFFQSPNNRAIIGSAPAERSGGAAGLQSTGRLVGQSLGAAVMAVIFARGAAEPMAVAMWVGAGLTLAGAAASGLRKVGI
jgi:DHA2 family multidrug resistance protein-like MFS transporter